MPDYRIIESSSHSKYNFYYKYKETEKIKKKSHHNIIVLFLVIFIILFSTLTLYSVKIYDNNLDLYDKYYTTYFTTINRNNLKTPDTISIVFAKINDGNYNDALSILDKIRNRNSVVDFYTAVSLQEVGNYKEAIKIYNKVIKDKDNLFIEQSYWYIGLCYIKIGDTKNALENFKKIPENSFYKKQVDEIITKIN